MGAGAAVICPSLVAANSYILTETLTTFLLMIAAFFAMKALKEKNKRNWIISGVFLGFSTLCRPVTLLFPFFLLIGLLLFHPPFTPPLEGGEGRGGVVLSHKKRLQNLIFVIIFSLSMAAVVLPWIIRTSEIFIPFFRTLAVTSGQNSKFWQFN